MSIEDEELEAAILFPRVATAMAELVKKCHHPLGQFARLESERLRHQTRANKEAIRASDAETKLFNAIELLKECLPHITGGPEFNYLNNRIRCFTDRLPDNKPPIVDVTTGAPCPNCTWNGPCIMKTCDDHSLENLE